MLKNHLNYVNHAKIKLPIYDWWFLTDKRLKHENAKKDEQERL